MNTVNEYDQIRNMLGKIRLIREDVEPNNPAQIDIQNADDSANDANTKDGDKITFDGVNTIGFINSQNGISDDIKTSVTTSVGEFLKGTGLILDTVNITVDDGQLIMNSETIKNPGIDVVKSIIFNTDDENPKIEVIPGTIELNDDTITLLQSISRTYKDNQIGRTKLVSSTQGGDNAIEQP